MLVSRRNALLMAAIGALAVTGCTPHTTATGSGSTAGSAGSTIATPEDTTVDSRRDIQRITENEPLPRNSKLMYQGYVVVSQDNSAGYVATGDKTLERIPDDTVIEVVGKKSPDLFFVYRYTLGSDKAEELEVSAEDYRYLYVYENSATISEEDGTTYVRFPDLASY